MPEDYLGNSLLVYVNSCAEAISTQEEKHSGVWTQCGVLGRELKDFFSGISGK